MNWREFCRSRAAALGYPCPDVFARQMEVESAGFDEDVIYCRRFGSAGERGIAQFLPATAAGFGIDPCDPEQAVRGAVRYMTGNLARYGTMAVALAAYNAGGGNVNRYGGVPPFEGVRRYITAILGPGWPEPDCLRGPVPGEGSGLSAAALLGVALAAAGAVMAWVAIRQGA